MYIYYVRQKTRGGALNVKTKLKLINYLPQQNGKSLFYICTQNHKCFPLVYRPIACK